MREIKQAWSFDDVLLMPQHGVLEHRADADISSEVVPGFKIDIPIIAANMPSVTGWNMINAMRENGAFSIAPRAHNYVEYSDLLSSWCGHSIGIKDKFSVQMYSNRIVCIDVAHGDTHSVFEFIKQVKDKNKLIVGNIATYGAAKDLIDLGVRTLKVGIGPGAACITREVTGFGVPQLSAIGWVAGAIRDSGEDVRLIADGGIKNSGDIVKALAMGADTVMVGSLLAGCDEAPEPGVYYGNASHQMNGHNAPEGVSGTVERSGSVKDVLKTLAWGIRSGLSYGGATNIKELQQNAQWIPISQAGRAESVARI